MRTVAARTTQDVRIFFDQCAESYEEQHGDSIRLLRYRSQLLRQLSADFRGVERLLDIGCGDGRQLIDLQDGYATGTGIDLSPSMVEKAAQNALMASLGDRLSFLEQNAESLGKIADHSFDAVICVGALEHMLDKAAVLRSARRVLVPGGVFACLTVNRSYLWHSLGEKVGYPTRHLATDSFLNEDQTARLCHQAGFVDVEIGHWSFVPRGDMSKAVGALYSSLDGIGRSLSIPALRGGLQFAARNPV